MGKISKYNEGGEEGETIRYEQGEHEEKVAKGKKVGISGGGGGHTGKIRAHHESAKEIKHDKMAHKSHHEMNTKHGTGSGFVTGPEYTGGGKAGKGTPSMDENCASED